jgi:hypothetical protein
VSIAWTRNNEDWPVVAKCSDEIAVVAFDMLTSDVRRSRTVVLTASRLLHAASMPAISNVKFIIHYHQHPPDALAWQLRVPKPPLRSRPPSVRSTTRS